MSDPRLPDRFCQSYNDRLEVCLARATVVCTADDGLEWFACDVEAHRTKVGSTGVVVTPIVEWFERHVWGARP